MKAPYGAIVSLYVDIPRIVAEGHIIQTTTGRTYEIVEVRRQAKGKHVGRWHIKAVVVDEKNIDGRKIVHFIRWYKRGNKK
jgi:hypothetical protein